MILRSQHVVTGGEVRAASIHVRNNVIEAVRPFDDAPPDTPALDGVLMPGLVDTHVHINEPGRTEWEGFWTATRAAAAGGVTTLIEMPLNSIPATTSVEAYREKLRAAEGKCWVDVGFWGGVVPGNLSGLAPLWEAGVFGFKCFLVPSGVAEFGHVGERELRPAMLELARLNAVLLAHAEDPAFIEPVNGPSYEEYLESRPPRAEENAVKTLLRLSRETGARIHIVHLSSGDALRAICDAKDKGLAVSAETCPHYLFFSADMIPPGAPEFKCAPPIRERFQQNDLWRGLQDKWIELVVSDHSPSPPEMKRDGFDKAWGGISSLQLGLPVVWTAARERGASIEELASWMCFGPAKLAGLHHRKGLIEEGFDADLVLWNPEARFVVEPEKLEHRHKLTPYAGLELSGVVETTWLAGEQIYDRCQFGAAPTGRILKRGEI